MKLRRAVPALAGLALAFVPTLAWAIDVPPPVVRAGVHAADNGVCVDWEDNITDTDPNRVGVREDDYPESPTGESTLIEANGGFDCSDFFATPSHGANALVHDGLVCVDTDAAGDGPRRAGLRFSNNPGDGADVRGFNQSGTCAQKS